MLFPQSTICNPQSLIRPIVGELQAYVPGEQPKIKGLIKLNTNENPYPPSPRVLRAVRGAVDGRLRLYPNPTAERLREKLAKLHQCKPENIIVGMARMNCWRWLCAVSLNRRDELHKQSQGLV
jgi:histidinol-phosphate/aromatic aminotransferase/cobyric acid decarboxylase-like protein